MRSDYEHPDIKEEDRCQCCGRELATTEHVLTTRGDKVIGECTRCYEELNSHDCLQELFEREQGAWPSAELLKEETKGV